MKSILCSAIFTLLIFASASAAPVDSIGVYKDGERVYILHMVTRGESLYSISHKYSVKINEIVNANPNIKEDLGIAEGWVLKIPKGTITASTANQQKPANQPVKEEKKVETVIKEVPQEKKPEPVVVKETITENKPDPVNTNTNVSTNSNSNSNSNKSTNTNNGQIEHVVQIGETLYGISKKYNVRVTDIAHWNNLSNLEIRSGQVLIIKKGTQTASKPVIIDKEQEREKSENMLFEEIRDDKPVSVDIAKPVKVREEPSESLKRETAYSLKYKEDASSMYYKETTESGIATWIKDASPNTTRNGYFALHKTLPVGTIIKIKNPMNGKVVYAKVIGNLPDNQDNKNILLKLPQSAAKEMNVLDERMNMQVTHLVRAKDNG